MQQVTPLTGYNSQNLELHFGLGDAAVVDSVLVRWPSGSADTLVAIPAGQMLIATEGSAILAAPPAPRCRDDLRLTVRPVTSSAGALTLECFLPAARSVTLTLFDTQGRSIAGLWSGALAAGVHRITSDVAARVATGCYWVRLSDGHGACTARVAILH